MDVKHARRIGILMSLSLDTSLRMSFCSNRQHNVGRSGNAASSSTDREPIAYPEVRVYGGNPPVFGIYGRHPVVFVGGHFAITGIAGDTRPDPASLGRPPEIYRVRQSNKHLSGGTIPGRPFIKVFSAHRGESSCVRDNSPCQRSVRLALCFS
jgi:hypothetical protein